jgi:hypothetical protein
MPDRVRVQTLAMGQIYEVVGRSTVLFALEA